MNKRYKLLSLLLCAGIVTSTFPSLGAGATSDSIAFYNSKKSILEMEPYDESYDTNHDGVVNVFDVIRENKEVFQEESYTDLKAQIHSLETQIEILTQKLAEKEDKSQAESTVSEINSVLSSKLDRQDGKQLSSNNYTDEEKQKLDGLNNYDDTSIKSDISAISTELSGKVDVQEGKQLSSNDYTDEEKNKLASLENYNDCDIKSEISSINSELSSINSSLSSKVDKQEGKQLSSNDYTDSDKEKLKILENYDDTKINDKIDLLVQAAYEEKKEIESSIDNKVDKEEGKQLSSNDYTDEEKQKLESLNNYDDTELKNEINEISNNLKSNDRTVYVSKVLTGENCCNSFKTACENAFKTYGTKVIVLDGEYDLVSEFGETYLDNLTESPGDPGGFGVMVGNGMNIEFRNGSSLVFNYTGDNWITQQLFSPIHVSHDSPEFSIKGAKIIANNCRYCIHMEAHAYQNYYKQSVTDCILIHDNRTGSEVYTYACIGVGTGVQADVTIENNFCKSYPYKRSSCDFSNPNNGSEVIITHTSSAGTKQLNQVIKNNFIDGGSIKVYGYRDVCESLAIITGNRLNSEPSLETVQDETDVESINLINFSCWNNEIVPYSY